MFRAERLSETQEFRGALEAAQRHEAVRSAVRDHRQQELRTALARLEAAHAQQLVELRVAEVAVVPRVAFEPLLERKQQRR